MGTYKKLETGRWQAQIARHGKRKAKSFKTKREAQDWAARQEYLTEHAPPQSNVTFGDMLERYGREVSVTKRGARWEIFRLGKLCTDPVAAIRLCKLTPSDLADWRDRRLKEVAPSSVAREMTLLSAALNVARREWGLISVNPLADVRKPSEPPPRDRRVSDSEVEKLLEHGGDDLSTKTARTIHAFRFAIETAMRAGEIVGLTWAHVDFEKHTATLPRTKNGTSRQVPLSSAAILLLEALPRSDDACFAIDSRSLDVLFRKVRDRAKIVNLRFHDSRHEAITRLSRKLNVLSLARVVGHKDIKMLQIYYNETAEELARRLG